MNSEIQRNPHAATVLCRHLGERVDKVVTETGKVYVHNCSLHGKCTLVAELPGVACCNFGKSCRDYAPEQKQTNTGPTISSPSPRRAIEPCKFLGEPAGESLKCQTCGARGKEVQLHTCQIFGKCSVSLRVINPETGKFHACCNRGFCPEYQAKEEPVKMRWAYGVTTVASRRDDLLPKTLKSLAAAGFDKPRLFVDDAMNREAWWWENNFGLEVVVRWPKIRPHGNWVLSLMELFIREPNAERYALFQDDLVCYRNLREYLERTPMEPKCYWNLYTFPENARLRTSGRIGFYDSNQRGKGALGLVFSREGVLQILSSAHMVERPMNAERGWKNIDGGVVDSFHKIGWKEQVHYPSLLQHTGHFSTIKRGQRPSSWLADTFRGEAFDALELL